MTEDPSKGSYLRSIRRQKIIAVGMVILAFVFLFLLFGVCKNDRVTLQDGFDVLITHLKGNIYPERLKEYIFWETLFPRALSAIFVGGTLGIAGAAMQHIMRNPLADPYTTGISSGAGLGATLFLVLEMSVIPGLTGQTALVTNAFLLSLIPMSAILLISIFKKTSPSDMILIGIAIMYFFSATNTVLMLIAEPNDLQGAYSWGLGNLGAIGWPNMAVIIVSSVAGSLVLTLLSKRIQIVSMNDGIAKSLGENPHNVRIITMLVVSLMVACVVAFTGTIGFVGIVAPHIVRLTMGANTKYLVPSSFCLGAVLLTLSDTMAKIVALPVGVITSIIGGPLFLFILIKQRKKEMMV